jgi:hypothetical protein
VTISQWLWHSDDITVTMAQWRYHSDDGTVAISQWRWHSGDITVAMALLDSFINNAISVMRIILKDMYIRTMPDARRHIRTRALCSQSLTRIYAPRSVLIAPYGLKGAISYYTLNGVERFFSRCHPAVTSREL